MKIAVLTTGDEIMAGNIADTNASWISDKAWQIGHNVVLHIAVGDDDKEIQDALKISSEKANVVIISGGLGATVDDITLESASKFFNKKMTFHEDLWTEIKDLFEMIGRDCSENNKKQAYMPEGANALKNRLGTAPGVHINCKNVDYFFVPGVPTALTQIFTDSIEPYIKEKSETPGYSEKFLKCFGLPEATFDQMIRDVKLGDVRLSFRVSFPEVKIKLVARSKTGSESKKMTESAAEKIRGKLNEYIYGEDEETLEEVVGKILLKKKMTLATAESCTGGLVASRITDISGSSNYFNRGFVTYSNEAKVENLRVPRELIEKHGAVSREVAESMATGAVAESGADVAIAITGIAGPTGGTEEKPVGTVHIAIAGPKGIVHRRDTYSRDRLWFKEIVAAQALDMLRRYLISIK